MTEQQQRIAIAEFCGWDVVFDTLCNITPDHNGEPVIEPIAPLPNYTSDLNAMHESEKLLDLQSCGEYARRLREIVEMKTNLPWVDDGSFAHIHASSDQRAEALLRTIGKWEES